jgi:Tol biopolymer transport system component
MVFVRPDETEQEWLLTLADREGHDEQVLVRRSSRAGRLDGPAWSPDGKLIAVDTIVLNDKARAYHVLMGFRADTGEETLLAPQHWNYIQSIAWLPDGTGLLVCGVDRDGGIEGIWLVSYPGGPAPRRLTNELSHFRGVTVTADGGKIVTSQGDLQASIWLVSNGDTSRGTKLTPLNGLFGEVALMPDGRIVYVLGDDLWIMAADGSGQRQLTFGQGRNVEPRVTANGRYVVFSSSRAGNYNIWRLDLDNGELQQLTSGGRDSRPLCTSDGRWVIYTSQIQSTSTAWKVPLAGGEPTQIGGMDSGSGVVAAISPDDKLLAYQARDMSAKGGQKLYAAIGPLGGGAFRSLPLQNIPRSQGRLDLYWSPDGLIYNAFKDIWLQPIEGGQPKRLTNFAGEGEHVIDFAPNGKNLVVTRGESTWDAVLISVK